MKTKIIISLIILFCVGFGAQGQVKLNLKKKTTNQANNRANRKSDELIDKGFDKLEDGIGSLFGKKKKNKKKKGVEVDEQAVSQEQGSSQFEGESPKSPNVLWSKFDFVPGDEVIFEDGPDIMEENGEFPSRWDLVDGQIEIANVDGENVMMFIDGAPRIVPFLKNAKDDYLPEVFTIEFDFYKPVKGNRISVYLFDYKNQERNHKMYMDISSGGVSEKLHGIAGDVPGIDYNNSADARWIHISIAYTKGKLKVYMDDTRVINIPHYSGNPTGLSLQAYWADLKDNKAFYFKNVRIAKGGVKYYDRVLSDGKIIVNGIRFDVNKATLKPESMGPINKIYELMQKQSSLNFSVEGHTDADGDDTNNQRLSEARAKVVMNKLIEMGIAGNRLKSAGFGESKPIGENGTPEGKANNRRVEFVKFEGNSSATNTSGGVDVAFDRIDKDMIGEKLEILEEEYIQISNHSGILLGKGTTVLYATTDGNLGKMKFLDVDKYDNYALTVKYVTYNYDGSVHSQSNKLKIDGTYTCDLDKGETEDVIQSEYDFFLKREDKKSTSLRRGETSMLRVLPN